MVGRWIKTMKLDLVAKLVLVKIPEPNGGTETGGGTGTGGGVDSGTRTDDGGKNGPVLYVLVHPSRETN